MIVNAATKYEMKFAASRFMHASGGIRYHLRAIRYRQTLWTPFRAALASWLDCWRPACRRLVVIGPSGGHTLPAGLFARFDDVTALEPDPVARVILRRRQADCKLRFESFDCLSNAAGMGELAGRFGDRALLFCNVLGQVGCPDPDGWSECLATRLSGCHWASWHDVISTNRQPMRTDPVEMAATQSLESILGRFWPGGELPLIDHGTLALGRDGPHAYATWALTPTANHLIEWCSHAARP